MTSYTAFMQRQTRRQPFPNRAKETTAPAAKTLPQGLFYEANYLAPKTKSAVLAELEGLRPIWEQRFSKSNPPPEGKENRQLLRPVYWLGNWQFACLNYYHPPKGIEFRCVRGEAYPPALAAEVAKIESFVRANYTPRDLPRGWNLNTCLVNYYGAKEGDPGKWTDSARVGEHKDFEPGPVASLSFGERALFQFVASEGKQAQSQVRLQMWLEDNSLQIFGGDKWKKHLFHRVQRVEDKDRFEYLKGFPGYRTRRINLTFRYVPDEHILPLAKFPPHLLEDIKPYVTQLAEGGSAHFREALSSVR
ncbi:MAG: alpha-ketoglutarate-dependent dioxygenase AlkB [Bdellovibrionaceae bacterium]|nr:alpha-ketoglutarate-dependent dioxygenase AlkB [Pseudobdellovibrionaceae bacterium]